jgi:branched-chain amino acid transport system permease protein
MESVPFWRREAVPAFLFVALAALPVIAAMTGDSYLVTLATRVMIFALAALSLDLILGSGGLVSFGHAAFLGLGGYAVGILSEHGAHGLEVQVPVAILAGATFAALTSLIALRTRGVHFIMITLAFGQMAFFTATSLARYGGDDGLSIAARSDVFGWRGLENQTTFYVFVLVILLAAYLLCRALVASRFGRVLRAAAQNEARVEAMGFNPFTYRLIASVIAGVLCSLAGVLLANQTEFVAPAYMSWQRSGELIVMVVLGGIGSLHGAILGAFAFLLLEEWLSGLTEHWKVIFGPLLVLIVLFWRGGLMGALRRIGLG